MEIFDIAVVGQGPAGLSAALNASIRHKSVLLLGPETSEKLNRAERVDNYLGLEAISGKELLKTFQKQVEKRENIHFIHQRVETIYDMGDYIGLLLGDNEILKAKAVVLATGVHFGQLIPGEEEFLGRGVSSCVICDAALYKNKPCVLVGYTQEAGEEANFLSDYASSLVFVNRTDKSFVLKEGIRETKAKPLRIEGDIKARRIILEDERIEGDGFFFLHEAKKADSLVPGLILDGSHIQVDEKMQTNLKGIFAAGDVVGPPYQVMIATGRGQLAGLEAASYVAKIDVSYDMP